MRTCAAGGREASRARGLAGDGRKRWDEFSYGGRGSPGGIGIALRDSQADRINANNWILPAISVSLERRAAQLRNAPQTTTTASKVVGMREQAPQKEGPEEGGSGKEKRKRTHPRPRRKFVLPRSPSPSPSPAPLAGPASHPPTRRLRDLFSLFYARARHMRFPRTPYFLSERLASVSASGFSARGDRDAAPNNSSDPHPDSSPDSMRGILRPLTFSFPTLLQIVLTGRRHFSFEMPI